MNDVLMTTRVIVAFNPHLPKELLAKLRYSLAEGP